MFAACRTSSCGSVVGRSQVFHKVSTVFDAFSLVNLKAVKSNANDTRYARWTLVS